MIFNDRERGEEERFRRAAETRFRLIVHRDRLMGGWAATRMALSTADAALYAKSVVLADLQEAGDNDVIRKISADFIAAGVAFNEEELRQVLAEMEREAGRSIQQTL